MHFLARQLTALSHDVRLIPARYVKPFVHGYKSDYRDAETSAGGGNAGWAILSSSPNRETAASDDRVVHNRGPGSVESRPQTSGEVAHTAHAIIVGDCRSVQIGGRHVRVPRHRPLFLCKT